MRKIHPILFVIILCLLTSCSDKPPQLARLSHDAVILAFGDSLTHGTGTTKDQSYPAVLARKIGRTVVNAGVPGEVSETGLARLPKLLEEYNPALVIICHGGNDFLRKKDKQKLAENIRAMISLSQSHGAEVILIGVPKPGLLLSSADFYQEIADEFMIPYQGEIVSDILSTRNLKSDTIHPNQEGYAFMADAIYQIMHKAGAISP